MLIYNSFLFVPNNFLEKTFIIMIPKKIFSIYKKKKKEKNFLKKKQRNIKRKKIYKKV